MKDRIRQIMESQHMTQQVFADYIGQSPATLSSIFNGRTRPTLNIVEAIKKKIPNISTDWLMFGSGSMFLSDSDDEGPHDPEIEGRVDGQNLMLDFDSNSSPTPQIGSSNSPIFNSVKTTRPELAREEIKVIDKMPRKVIEIRVFYDDQTWETFVPVKK